MVKPETTAGSGNGDLPPTPRRSNEWLQTNFKPVKGLRDGEVVEVANDLYESQSGVCCEHEQVDWSKWAWWRRFQIESTETEVRQFWQNAEAVDHPAHYNAHPSGIECIDVVRHMNFNLGNVVKYLWRAGEKDPAKHLEDLKKAAWYLNDEIERLSK